MPLTRILRRREDRSGFPSYVKLDVSGVKAEDLNDLNLNYTGTALRDTSDAKNQVVCMLRISRLRSRQARRFN